MLIIAAVMAVFLCAHANAQAVCAPRANMLTNLAKWQERIVSAGVTEDGTATIELYVSPKGTFSIMVTNARGLACLIAGGHDWQGERPPKETAL
jgi:hypothetical protein